MNALKGHPPSPRNNTNPDTFSGQRRQGENERRKNNRYIILRSSIITPAIKHIKCHAGPLIRACPGPDPGYGAGSDPASSPILDSRFRGNDGFDIYGCLSINKPL